MIYTTFYDNYVLAGAAVTVPASGVRNQFVIDLAPNAQSLHRNVGAIITFASDELAELYEWQPSWLDKPEDTFNRPTDWMNAGTEAYKYVHGCRITADTGGLDRTVQIQYDGGTLGPLLTINHLGEVTKPYSFPPFKAHLLRLLPTGASSWRLMNILWEVDEEPELTSYWVTQPTTWDFNGYAHLRDFQFAWASLRAGAQLNAIVDGVTYPLATLPATQGVELKQYFSAPPIKGKIWQFSLTGQPAQVYAKDCEMRIKPWGANQYLVLRPIGGDSATSGGARL